MFVIFDKLHDLVHSDITILVTVLGVDVVEDLVSKLHGLGSILGVTNDIVADGCLRSIRGLSVLDLRGGRVVI